MRIVDRLRSLSSPIALVACRGLLNATIKRGERLTLELVRVKAERDTLRGEVDSLRKGTKAGSGFFQASAEAFEDVIDACRTLVDAQDGETLEKAIGRLCRRLEEARLVALDVARERDTLKQNLATLERVGGVNGVARLALHCGEHEPLSSAAARVMGELAAAKKRVAELERGVS